MRVFGFVAGWIFLGYSVLVAWAEMQDRGVAGIIPVLRYMVDPSTITVPIITAVALFLIGLSGWELFAKKKR